MSIASRVFDRSRPAPEAAQADGGCCAVELVEDDDELDRDGE